MDIVDGFQDVIEFCFVGELFEYVGDWVVDMWVLSELWQVFDEVFIDVEYDCFFGVFVCWCLIMIVV